VKRQRGYEIGKGSISSKDVKDKELADLERQIGDK